MHFRLALLIYVRPVAPYHPSNSVQNLEKYKSYALKKRSFVNKYFSKRISMTYHFPITSLSVNVTLKIIFSLDFQS